MRRWLAIFAVATTLLGLSLPTFACAMGAPDCCSGSHHAPCDAHPGGAPLIKAAPSCCALVPVLHTTSNADRAPDRPDTAHFAPPPDPARPVDALESIPPPTLVRGADAAQLTYLRTGRLRL
jgi:hypothetical protein